MRTWIVTDFMHGDGCEIEAERCSVNHGALQFDNGCGIFRAIAAGWWTSVIVKDDKDGV